MVSSLLSAQKKKKNLWITKSCACNLNIRILKTTKHGNYASACFTLSHTIGCFISAGPDIFEHHDSL